MVIFYGSVAEENLEKKNDKYYVSGTYGINRLKFYEDLDNYIYVNKYSDEVLNSNLENIEGTLKMEDNEKFSKNIKELKMNGSGVYYGIIRKRDGNKAFKLDLSELTTYIGYNEYYGRVCFQVDPEFVGDGWYVEDDSFEESLKYL